MNKTTFLLLIFSASTWTQPCFALKASDYDADDDKHISLREQAQFAREQISPPLARFDWDRNGKLEGAELTAVSKALTDLNEEASLLAIEFQSDYPNGQELAQFAAENKTEDAKLFKKDNWLSRIPLKIRETHEDITHSADPKPMQKVKPAQVAFTRDISSDNKILLLKGALLWPLKLNEKAGLIGVPSLTLNKVSNDNNPEKETDSMALRFGLEWEKSGPRNSTIYWRVNPTWTTDTSFDLDVRGVELQVEPVRLFPGTGRARFTKGGALGIRWRSILHTEYGKVEDNNGNEKLVLGETFTRAGLKIDTLLVTGATDRVSLAFGWEYLATISGDLRDRKLFKATLSYNVDDLGHFQLLSGYSNGDTSAALENQNLWTVGLGLKF